MLHSPTLINVFVFFISAIIFHQLYKCYFFNLDRLEKIKSKNPEAYKRTLQKLIEEKESGWFPYGWFFSSTTSEKLKQMYEESENSNNEVEEIRV